jgi:hypothetical protein
MSLSERFSRWFAGPPLTKGRIWFAFTVAVTVDSLQLAFGPLGWLALDEILDVVAMVLTSIALGFHMLLLPTFVLELIPGPDMLPTWTGCTAAVVMLRKRAQRQSTSPPPIDVLSEVTRVPPGPPSKS